MSQLVKIIEAYKHNQYLFRIALDRIPDADEKEQIKVGIQAAMEQLGVSRDRVAVNVYKSDLPAELATGEESPEINRDRGYLLCILVRSEPGVLQQDPDEIVREELAGFLQFSGLGAGQVAAVVLDNAYLEVQSRNDPPPSSLFGHVDVPSRWNIPGETGPQSWPTFDNK